MHNCRKLSDTFLRHDLALTIFKLLGVVAALSTSPSTFLRRTSPFIVSCLLLGGQFSSAQDALRTAVNADRSEVARQLTAATPGNERIKAGPFEFNVGLTYGLEYTDNVRNVRSPREDDFVQTPVLDLKGFLPVTDTGRLSLGFGVGYADYFEHNDLDRLYFSPNSELAYDFTVKDFRFTLYDSFDYSYDVQSVGALAGVSQFPHFQNTVGLRALWAPSAWSYQAGYSHFNFISDNSGTDTGGFNNDNNFSRLDRSSEQVFGRIAYSVAPATRVGLELSSALTDYSDAAQPDNVSFSIGPFTEWQVTEAITMSLRGGFTHYSFDSTPGSLPSLKTNVIGNITNIIVVRPDVIRNASEAYELNSYYAGMEINHRLTEFITHGLSASHSIQPGINQGSDYTESTDVSYHVSWILTQNTTVGAEFGYSHGTETQTQIPERSGPIVIIPSGFDSINESYDTYRLGLSASYRLSQQATVTLAYSHYRRESINEERSYFQNRVSLGFRYQF